MFMERLWRRSLVVELMHDQLQEQSFHPFFPPHDKKISLGATHQAVQRGFCCSGIPSSGSSRPAKRSRLLSVGQIQAELTRAIVRIKMVLIRKASPLQIRKEKPYLGFFL